MNATYATSPAAPLASSAMPRPLGIFALRVLLLIEAGLALAVTIGLSLLAADAGANEEALRFAAAGVFIVAIASAVAARGARRGRPWSWTTGALIQVAVAGGTAAVLLIAEWHPAFIAGFVLPAAVMLVLSSASVRRYLGQH